MEVPLILNSKLMVSDEVMHESSYFIRSLGFLMTQFSTVIWDPFWGSLLRSSFCLTLKKIFEGLD